MRRTLLLASAAALLAAPAFAQNRSQTQTQGHAQNQSSGTSGSSMSQLSTQEFIKKAQMSDRFEIASSRLAQQHAQSQEVKSFAGEMVRDHTRTTQELTDLMQRMSGPQTSSNSASTGGQMASNNASGSQMGSNNASGSQQNRAGSGSTAGAGASMTGSSGGSTQSGAAGGMDATGLDAEHQQIMQRLNQAQGAEFDRLYMQAQVQGHQQAVQMFQAYSQHGDNAALKQWAGRTLPTLQTHLQHAQKVQKSL